MSLFDSPKVKHYKSQLEVIDRKIWDAEFHRDKLRKIRESVRKEYDRLNEKKNVIEGQKEQVKDNAEAVKGIEQTVESLNVDLEQLGKQIAGLDNEIENEQNPQSIVNRIAALNATKTLLKAYINRL
jgi:chromosome segregation ATPase